MEQISPSDTQALLLLDGQRKVLDMIASGRALRETLTELAHFLEHQSPDILCSILLLDRDGEHVRHGAAPSLPDAYNQAIDGLRIGPDAGSCGTAAFRREAVFVQDIATDPLWKNYSALALSHGLRACWSTPIFDAQRTVLGTFAVYLREPKNPEQRHLNLIDIAVHLASIAIVRQREESELRRSEARLAAAQEQARIGSWEMDLAAGTETWSAELYRLFNRDPALGAAKLPEFLELVHPEDRATLLSEFEASLQSGGYHEHEFRSNPECVAQMVLFATSRSTRDAGGKVAYLTGTIQDISARRAAEAALRASEDRYARAIRGTSDGLWDWNVIGGEHYISPRWKNLLGYDETELSDHRDYFSEFLHPDDAAAVRQALSRHFNAGQPFDIEFRLRTKQGEYRWFRSRGQAQRDAQGRPVRMAGAITDVTERRRTEASLVESERRLRDAQSVGLIGDWQFDIETGAIVWSDVLYQLFERDPALGPPNYDENMAYYFPEDSKRLQALVEQTTLTGENFATDLHLRLPSGRETYHMANGRTLKDESGKVVKLYGTAQDITARKRAEENLRTSEEQLRALLERFHTAQEEERTRVAREIHDELGQLLTGLKMDVRWIERKLSEPGIPAAFNPLLERIVAASELTDATIAAVQKIAAELRPGALDKLGLAAALTQRARRFQERTSIACTVRVAEDDLPLRPKIADELFYICQEALTNVARHSNATSVEITLKTDARTALLEVCDDGIGIPTSALAAPDSLGLLGMRERALQCGGTIMIQRREPHGTRVHVTVPLVPGSRLIRT